LVEHDVPMPEALLLAGDSVPDIELRRACRRLSRDVQAGMPLAPAADNVRGFPATFVQTLMWEHHRRAFPEALHAVAGLFESRSRIQAGLITAVAEPLLLIVTGGLLGYIVLGLFMPLVKLLNVNALS
ncbi:MAG: type II secretion system F family protein, partial [Planctomycetaceae bacterium]